MKKLISFLAAASVLTVSLVAEAASVPADVGALNSDKTKVISSYSANQVATVVKGEYQKESKLKSFDGTANFNFGTSSSEKVHIWAGTAFKAMVQDFSGGNSTATDTNFGHGKGWAVIVINPANPNVAYTVRDAILTNWGENDGGANSTDGYPTSEQFWSNGSLYQNFSKGYFELKNGDPDLVTFVQNKSVADTHVYENPKFSGNGGTTTTTANNGGGTTTTTTGNNGTGTTTANNGNGTTGGNTTTANSAASGTASNAASSSVSGKTSNSNLSTASALTPDSSLSNSASDSAVTTTTTVTKLNVGATVALIAIIAVVVLGGGFALYWFVLRKKFTITKMPKK